MALNRIHWGMLLLGTIVLVSAAYYGNLVAREATTTNTQVSTTPALGLISGQTWSYGCPAMSSGQLCGSPYPYYPVTIYNAASGQLVTTVTSDGSGHFSVTVQPGQYVIYTKVYGGSPGTPGNFYGGPCAYPSTFSPSWQGCASAPEYLTVIAGGTVTVTINVPNGIE
jgi:hypothetical protein